jgi:hypothetical protein
LHKIKHLFKCGVVHRVKDGRLTQFWNDVWITSSPQRVGFPRLFAICENKELLVADCANMGWDFGRRRMLDADEYRDWNALQELLKEVTILPGVDEVCKVF